MLLGSREQLHPGHAMRRIYIRFPAAESLLSRPGTGCIHKLTEHAKGVHASSSSLVKAVVLKALWQPAQRRTLIVWRFKEM